MHISRRTIAGAGLVALLVLVGSFNGSPATASHPNRGILTIGPDGGNGEYDATFRGMSTDGHVVWFVTDEPLVAADQDGFNTDVYESRDGIVSLVSTGSFPGANTDTAESAFLGASKDGSIVFFSTKGRFEAADNDAGHLDIYQRAAGTTSLVSTGGFAGAGTAPVDATFYGASDDGKHVVFVTTERLEAGDNEGVTPYGDPYERFGGATYLVATGSYPGAGTDLQTAGNPRISADGSRIYFETAERLEATDLEAGHTDVYVRTNRAATTLISTGSAPGAGFANAEALLQAISGDGSVAVFSTPEKLENTDQDANEADFYARAGSVTSLVSTGSAAGADGGGFTFVFDAISDDGERIFFSTNGKMVNADTDGNHGDVYERSGGSTKLISTGSAPNVNTAPLDIYYNGSSSDGSMVFIDTDVTLEPVDTDGGKLDVYQRTNGATTLLSTGSAAGANSGQFDAFIYNYTPDGSHVLMDVEGVLEPADKDAKYDVYERTGNTTTLVSIGPKAGSDATSADSFGDGISSDGSRIIFETAGAFSDDDLDETGVDLYVAAAPKVGFAKTSLSVREQAGTRDVPVKLDSVAPQAVTVKYARAGGTSNAADATVGGSGSVTIPAGETTAAIPITLLQDFRVEASETLILKLSSPDRALLGDATFTLTITDDEPKAKCDGKDATIVGSNGPDTIKGTPGADVIVGRRGTDKIDGLAGNDTICGTGGADELAGGGGNDMLIGGNGNDQLMGESGKDTLDGGLGRDRFSGGPGDGDTCKGGPGTDTLEPKHGCEVVDTIP